MALFSRKSLFLFFLFEILIDEYFDFCLKNSLNITFGGPNGLSDLIFDNDGHKTDQEDLLTMIECHDLHLDCQERLIFTNNKKSGIFVMSQTQTVSRIARYYPGKL